MKSNTIAIDFAVPSAVKAAMRKYGNRKDMLFGENSNGEKQEISIKTDNILLTTYQHNGFIRKNEYDKSGKCVGEFFDEKWV